MDDDNLEKPAPDVYLVACRQKDKNIIFSNMTQFKANTLDLVWAKGDVCFTHEQFFLSKQNLLLNFKEQTEALQCHTGAQLGLHAQAGGRFQIKPLLV